MFELVVHELQQWRWWVGNECYVIILGRIDIFEREQFNGYPRVIDFWWLDQGIVRNERF